MSPDPEPRGDRDVQALLQRLMDLATLSTPPAVRSDGPERAHTATRAPRWVTGGALWLALLLLPGSFLLLPALVWWRARRVLQ
jgi:hypothetical protein